MERLLRTFFVLLCTCIIILSMFRYVLFPLLMFFTFHAHYTSDCTPNFPKNRYLEMNNWDLEAAMQNAKDDIAWEKSQQQPPPPPKKELEDISSLALEAHIAIPVTTTTSVKKKKKNIELELGSVTAKKQEQRNPLTTTKKQMKGLFRPLLPR
uniref:Uncharacterized protein n=1 Tax=Ditylum brightwellii TaxID=49249 RepID=A0A7S4UVP6_9STRA|mmetsp:Transcript_34977/g.52840  ORF Transcript_34977/g.52840 Transcript_34977/m.52840 type:complete len:153 (+) Transcript_34977:679-1137(+)